MDARLDLLDNPMIGKFVKHLIAANHAVSGSPLPVATQNLVRLRASQINGCSGCTDMHYKEAVAAGESAVRLNLVAAWRDATTFTEAERAALELTEQGTRIADGAAGVTDDAWARATEHYDDEQLAALVAVIGLINVFNPAERHHPAARRRLPARSVLTGPVRAVPAIGGDCGKMWEGSCRRPGPEPPGRPPGTSRES